MADNTQLPIPSTSGDVIAADDMGGIKFQRVKLTLGADGVNEGDLSSSNPLPSTITNFPATQDVNIISNTLPSGAATDATLLAINALQVDIRDLNDTIVTLLSAMLDKMPRSTANDQAAVSVENTPNIGTVTTVTGVTTVSTVTGVTTVSTLTNQSQIGGQEALTVARSQIMAGANYIYNNIEVS